MLSLLHTAMDAGLLRPLDYHFARFVATRGGHAHIQLLAALVSFELHQGHACLDVSPKSLVPLQHRKLFALAEAPTWSQLCQTVTQADPGLFLGLMHLEYEHLYLMRYWHHEVAIAHTLFQMAQVRFSVDVSIAQPLPSFLLTQVQQAADVRQCLIEQLDIVAPEALNWSAIEACVSRAKVPADLRALEDFIPLAARCNWQTLAVALALQRQICVIAGGPGTGKTTIVARLITALLASPAHAPERIMLAAPTGKAATRMVDALHANLDKEALTAQMHQKIPEIAMTVHRLLGIHPQRARPKYYQHNPLPVDLLIIDEASMIDVALMAQILDALPANARLVLLGDPHQLASVEAGALLREMCEGAHLPYSAKAADDLMHTTGFTLTRATQAPSFRDNVCLLQKSWRFAQDSGIGQFAQLVKAGQTQALPALLNTPFADLRVHTHNHELLEELIVQHYGAYMRALGQSAFLTAETAIPVFKKFQAFCILAAQNQGRTGTIFLNTFVEKCLQKAGLLPAALAHWYVGRPVMIRENAPDLSLYNGDIGITAHNSASDLCVWFEHPKHPETARSVRPLRLPRLETSFAMTIHKSQGSEFEHCALVLPQTPSSALGRELLYTGITRARAQLDVFASVPILSKAIALPMQRNSALHRRLHDAAQKFHKTENNS